MELSDVPRCECDPPGVGPDCHGWCHMLIEGYRELAHGLQQRLATTIKRGNERVQRGEKLLFEMYGVLGLPYDVDYTAERPTPPPLPPE